MNRMNAQVFIQGIMVCIYAVLWMCITIGIGALGLGLHVVACCTVLYMCVCGWLHQPCFKLHYFYCNYCCGMGAFILAM